MVCIVIVNYNGWRDTLACIRSILLSVYTEYKIIIVDNASSDHSVDELQKHLKLICKKTNGISKNVQINEVWYSENIFLIQAINNAGFATGNNIALRWIKRQSVDFQYVWFLNNDTIIDSEALGSFVERMESESSRLGVLGGKLFYYDTENILQGAGGLYNSWLTRSKHIGCGESDEGQYEDRDLKMDYIIGASMFIRKEFIVDVGLMCEDYFLYFEELDWLLRGKCKGWFFGYEPKVKVFHKEGASTFSSKKVNLITDSYFVRNKFLFTYKFYPICLLSVCPVIVISLLLRIKRGRFRQIGNICCLIFEIVRDIFSGKIRRGQVLEY